MIQTRSSLDLAANGRRPNLALLVAALFAALVVAVSMALATGAVALAQDAEPLSPAALEAARAQVSNDEVNEIAREIWCPLCAGVRLDSCELKACDQMKDVIRIKLAQGEGLQSIQAYFLDQYGPQVLGAPPAEGFNLMAWVLPVVVMVAGALYLVLRARASKPSPEAASATASAVSVTGPPSAAAPGAPAAIDTEYARKLEEELRRHD